MKTLFKFWLIGFFAFSTKLMAQEINKTLAPFEKIIVSPKINVILKQGDHEQISIVYAGVTAEKIHARVSGKTLHLFLDGARIIEKRKNVFHNDYQSRQKAYRDASVTAYITYRDLQRLEVRGAEEISCDSLSGKKKFKLKAYGTSEITMAGLYVEKFKASLLGVNKLKINSGKVDRQKYRCYGENRIDARLVESSYASSHLYGEDRLYLNASHEFKISAIGEPYIDINGTPDLRKGIVIGKPNIHFH